MHEAERSHRAEMARLQRQMEAARVEVEATGEGKLGDTLLQVCTGGDACAGWVGRGLVQVKYNVRPRALF